MSKPVDSDSPGRPAGPPPAASLEDLTLRVEHLDAGTTALSVTSKPVASTAAEEAQTLTMFDWLDTIVDDVVHASDRLSKELASSAGQAEQTTTLATDFISPPLGLDRSAVLGQVVLGYSPIIDHQGGVVATRLTVVPMRASAALEAGALLDAIENVWPPDGGKVLLNVSSESMLNDLLRASPGRNVMIEVPVFMAAEPSNTDVLRELASRGNTLLIKGCPVHELPRAVLPCFKWSIIDFDDDRRIVGASEGSGAARTIPHMQAGVRTMAQMRLSFQRGAVAVIGWPMHEPIATHFEARPDLRVVLEMISRIDSQDLNAAAHQPLLRDPVLAYELMRHVTTAMSGPLQPESSSFEQAIALLGPRPLRRWLATVLGRADDKLTPRPVAFAALRRGLLMRMLASESSSQTRGELLMCGIFSLLDRIFARPFGELLGELAIPERIGQALIERRGPFFPLLQLARAIESEIPHDIRTAASAVFSTPAEINLALLRSLLVAAEFEQGDACLS